MRRMWSKGQIKSQISQASDEVVAAINGQAIAPASVTASGDITGNSIIENMTGYGGQFPSMTDVTCEPIYLSAVKNGNKLTMVAACNITLGDDATTDPKIFANISFPSSVGEKLYPTLIGAYNLLDVKKLYIASNINAGIDVAGYITKGSNTYINFCFFPGSMVKGTKYYFRYEVTFLLNDSLVS